MKEYKRNKMDNCLRFSTPVPATTPALLLYRAYHGPLKTLNRWALYNQSKEGYTVNDGKWLSNPGTDLFYIQATGNRVKDPDPKQDEIWVRADRFEVMPCSGIEEEEVRRIVAQINAALSGR